MRRTTLAIVVVAVVALAGCGGLPGGEDGTADGDRDPVYDPPLEGETVLEGHQDALSGADSFSYRQNTTVRLATSEGVGEVTNVTLARNRSTDRALLTREVTFQWPTTVYDDGSGTAYVREHRADGPAYNTTDPGGFDYGFYEAPPIDRYLDGLNYTYEGTAESGGTTVHVYTGSVDRMTPAEHGIEVIDPANVTELDSEIRIAEDGTVRSLRYRAVGTGTTGEELIYTLRIRYRDVGSTTVEEPAWVTEARNAT